MVSVAPRAQQIVREKQPEYREQDPEHPGHQDGGSGAAVGCVVVSATQMAGYEAGSAVPNHIPDRLDKGHQ